MQRVLVQSLNLQWAQSGSTCIYIFIKDKVLCKIVWWHNQAKKKSLNITSRVEENMYYKGRQPPQNILKAQVEEDYLKAGVGRSFFWELPESINTISTENIIQECFLST